MNQEPRVTIGFPVYNGEEFIREAIESILSQTFEDFELIIIDNKSDDNTVAICNEFTEDERVSIIENMRNTGIAANHNKCIQKARGKYFKWAHHDDLIAPEFLQECVDVLERRPDVILAFASGEYCIDENGNISRHSNWKDFDLSSDSPSCRLRQYLMQVVPEAGSLEYHFGLIRTSVLRRTAPLLPYPGADHVFFSELALRGKWYRVDKPLFYYRYHGGQSSRQESNESRTSQKLIDYISAISRVDMSVPEKALAFLTTIVIYTAYLWRPLLGEVRRGMKPNRIVSP